MGFRNWSGGYFTIIAWLYLAGTMVLGGCASTATAQNGVILDQQVNASGQGYTVLRVWGSHYEMGYAHASLLGDAIVNTVSEAKTLLGTCQYNTLREIFAGAVWLPIESEEELVGMVDALEVTHAVADIDKLDLKVISTLGDWGYACRSHMCWGRYVAPPIKTLATRRLDFGSPVPASNYHVLCAWAPDDGSPQWLSLGWPGMVTLVTGVNEYGTLASLHDYESHGADLSPGRMPRSVACRYALTFVPGEDLTLSLIHI